MSDAQLSWDEELSRALASDYASGLQGYVRRLVHDDQLAEDIVQETLLRAWKHAGQLAPGVRRAWMFTTARHLVIDAYRARKARPPETSDHRCDAAVESDSIESALDGVLLTDALNALSAEHRAVLFDCYYRGQTAAEIAAARGLPPGTVRSRIHYALRSLRLALQERGVTGP